jgi:hypothetical protein
MKDDWNAENYDSGAYTSTGLAAGYPRFQGVRRINQKLTTPTRDGCLGLSSQKNMEAWQCLAQWLEARTC